MASKNKPKSDLFSYYADLNEDDIDTDDDEQNENGDKSEDENFSFISKPSVQDSTDPTLPAPAALFESVLKPEFLQTKQKGEINWDKLTKNSLVEEEAVPTDTHRMPPPKSYEPVTEALKPTLGNTEEEQDGETPTKRRGGEEEGGYPLHKYRCDDYKEGPNRNVTQHINPQHLNLKRKTKNAMGN